MNCFLGFNFMGEGITEYGTYILHDEQREMWRSRETGARLCLEFDN